jgi:ankyrin repeat protein
MSKEYHSLELKIEIEVLFKKFLLAIYRGDNQYSPNPSLLPDGWSDSFSQNPTGWQVAHYLLPKIIKTGLTNAADYYGNTALHFSATKSNAPLVKKLVNHMNQKAIDSKNYIGTTAAHLAVLSGHPEICEILISKSSIEPMMTNNHFGVNCFHIAITRQIERFTPADIRIVDLLIDKCIESHHPELLFMQNHKKFMVTPFELAKRVARSHPEMEEIVDKLGNLQKRFSLNSFKSQESFEDQNFNDEFSSNEHLNLLGSDPHEFYAAL